MLWLAKFPKCRVWSKVPEGSTLIFEGTWISFQHSVEWVEGSSHVRNQPNSFSHFDRTLTCDRQTDRHRAIASTNLHVQFSASIKQATVVAQPVQCVGMLHGFPQSADQVEPLPRLRVRLRLELHGVRPRALRVDQRQHQKSTSQRTHRILDSTAMSNAMRPTVIIIIFLQCFDAVGWAAGRASGL